MPPRRLLQPLQEGRTRGTLGGGTPARPYGLLEAQGGGEDLDARQGSHQLLQGHFACLPGLQIRFLGQQPKLRLVARPEAAAHHTVYTCVTATAAFVARIAAKAGSHAPNCLGPTASRPLSQGDIGAPPAPRQESVGQCGTCFEIRPEALHFPAQVQRATGAVYRVAGECSSFKHNCHFFRASLRSFVPSR